MQIMRSCSAGFLLVSLFWLNLESCFGASEMVALQAKQWVQSQCGENVTLTCNASSSQWGSIVIKDFLWTFGNNTMCQYGQDQSNSEFQCKSTNSTFNHMITLTLHNVMPNDEGKYLCKLRSTGGSWSYGSQFRVEKCLPSSEASMNDTYAGCSFEGVYPSGVVHWFQGGTNLTKHTHTQEEKDKHERFNVRSVIKTESLVQPYNCSLWIPSLGQYVATKTFSSGTLFRLQWVCVVVTMMVRFMI